VVGTLAKLDKAFDELRYDDMADAIYHFVWGTFCDWYVELIKGAFDEETKAVAAWAFDQILVMLHPLMPFITEELWAAMGDRPYELIVAKWPEPKAQIDTTSKEKIETAIEPRFQQHFVEAMAIPHKCAPYEKLRAAVPFLYENSPFYRRRFDRLGFSPGDFGSVDDLEKWPVVDKTEMMTDAAEHPPYGTYTTVTDDVWAKRGWMMPIWTISARFFSPPEKPTLTGRLSISASIPRSAACSRASLMNSAPDNSASPRARRWELRLSRRNWR